VRLPVLALALGAFAIGTTEFVTMGLLPEMAATFDVSIPSAGWLATSYALGVVVGAPLLTAAAHRFPRRQVLIGLMVAFSAGHVGAVLAPTFGVLVATRVTLANVVGVPLGTAVGQHLGFGSGGMFAVLSYITPILTEVSGYAESRVPWLLVLFGLGATVATLLTLTGLMVMFMAERLDRSGRLPVEASPTASEPAPRVEAVAA
jgi:predicted MFS family arabinose efflux permease